MATEVATEKEKRKRRGDWKRGRGEERTSKHSVLSLKDSDGGKTLVSEQISRSVVKWGCVFRL